MPKKTHRKIWPDYTPCEACCPLLSKSHRQTSGRSAPPLFLCSFSCVQAEATCESSCPMRCSCCRKETKTRFQRFRENCMAVARVVGIWLLVVVCFTTWPPSVQAQPANGPETQSADAAGENSPAAEDPPQSPAAPASENNSFLQQVVWPLGILGIGVATVLGLIMFLKVNAFIALILAAMIVSLLAPGAFADKIGRVASAFGSTAGGIGIVIALAAVIGKCMLDSGAADRIVRAFLRLFGEKRSPFALMGSGFVLGIPVFFDTVLYLLVPLARSLHRRTGKEYLKYILAIGAGGAVTHTMVPPTPGPLLMAETLGIDIGWMIIFGLAAAAPAALGGVAFAALADRVMKTPMRSIGNMPDPEPLSD